LSFFTSCRLNWEETERYTITFTYTTENEQKVSSSQ